MWYQRLRAVFIWMSKSNWFCITSLHDWLKNSRHFFIQSDLKPKPIATRSYTFSRALRQLHVITTSFDWSVHCNGYVLYDWLEWLLLVLVLRHSVENRSTFLCLIRSIEWLPCLNWKNLRFVRNPWRISVTACHPGLTLIELLPLARWRFVSITLCF